MRVYGARRQVRAPTMWNGGPRWITREENLDAILGVFNGDVRDAHAAYALVHGRDDAKVR